jgi:hypothetical protein
VVEVEMDFAGGDDGLGFGDGDQILCKSRVAVELRNQSLEGGDSDMGNEAPSRGEARGTLSCDRFSLVPCCGPAPLLRTTHLAHFSLPQGAGRFQSSAGGVLCGSLNPLPCHGHLTQIGLDESRD